jgi:apolipoprotein N-acyltransferase
LGLVVCALLLQAMTSFIATLTFLGALVFSSVSRTDNAIGCLVMVIQSVVFGALFVGGNWINSFVIDYVSLNLASIVSLIAFLCGLIYFARAISGRLLLTRLTAFDPMFAEAANRWPRDQRVALAKRYRQTPTTQTLMKIYHQPTARS